MRVSELWYESFDDWRQSVIDEPSCYTRPSWASHPDYPFLKPHVDMASSFLLEQPVDEFLRDSRNYL